VEITQCCDKDHDWLDDPKFAWLVFFDWGCAPDSDPDMDAATVCEHIDSGAGDELFKRYRSQEDNRKFWGACSRHETIVLGAMMMRVGAKIKKEDLAHLRRLLVRSDNEMCPEGIAEFQAAIDNYHPGTPRTFGGPSCDTCGKTELDIDKKLSECRRCMTGYWTGGWSCSKVCVPHTYISFGFLILCCVRRPASKLIAICTRGRLEPTTSTSRNRKPGRQRRERLKRLEVPRKRRHMGARHQARKIVGRRST